MRKEIIAPNHSLIFFPPNKNKKPLEELKDVHKYFHNFVEGFSKVRAFPCVNKSRHFSHHPSLIAVAVIWEITPIFIF